MKNDINSNDLNRAMLLGRLSGNEIKVMLAYVDKGGWKAGTEVFLPKSLKEEYGLSDSTVKRARKTLVAQGWLIPTGKKSQWGCDKYLCAIPASAGRAKATDGSSRMTPRAGQDDLAGGSFWSTEVTKEVTKGSNEGSNKVEGSARRASHASASATASTDMNDKRVKEVKSNAASGRQAALASNPIDLDWDARVFTETKENGAVQNEPPSSKKELVQVGELDW